MVNSVWVFFGLIHKYCCHIWLVIPGATKYFRLWTRLSKNTDECTRIAKVVGRGPEIVSGYCYCQTKVCHYHRQVFCISLCWTRTVFLRCSESLQVQAPSVELVQTLNPLSLRCWSRWQGSLYCADLNGYPGAFSDSPSGSDDFVGAGVNLVAFWCSPGDGENLGGENRGGWSGSDLPGRAMPAAGSEESLASAPRSVREGVTMVLVVVKWKTMRRRVRCW